DFLDDTDRMFITGGRHARTSFIQRLPFARRHFRNYLPLFPMAIERMDVAGYDLIVSASYAVAKGVRKRPGQKHVCYIHTPMRWAWVKEEEYLRDHRVTGPKAAMLRWQLDRLRRWDLRTNAGVDRFVANSANVADRVRRHYGRDADVLLPPVDLDLFPLHTGPRKHFITASRLVPYKRTDRIVEAFRALPDQQLVVSGDGPELERLRRSAPTNVRFTGHVRQQELVHHLQRARALIVAADERGPGADPVGGAGLRHTGDRPAERRLSGDRAGCLGMSVLRRGHSRCDRQRGPWVRRARHSRSCGTTP
ncbi:MAG: glycosyltransferase, partial [Flavobacteriales bacterium]|nr:glycosyltransferase [Flavobacteriales bacterium]